MTPAIPAAPAGARCNWHPESPAAWACRRCGAFTCVVCQRRSRVDALPFCPACWSLRAKHLASLPRPTEPGPLGNAALLLGALSVLPVPVLQVVALGVAVAALVRGRRTGDTQEQRRGTNGLLLIAVGVAIDLVIVGFVGLL